MSEKNRNKEDCIKVDGSTCLRAESELKELENVIDAIASYAGEVRCNSKSTLYELFTFKDEETECNVKEASPMPESRIAVIMQTLDRIRTYIHETDNYLTRTRELISKWT